MLNLVINHRAHFDYQVEDKLLAGVVLTGQEVKSLRLKHGSLTGSYVKLVNGRPQLLNAQINQYRFATQINYDPKRTRRLLLTDKQLANLQRIVTQQKKFLIPLAFVLSGRFIKLELGIGYAKKNYQKKQHLKERDLVRELAREKYW